MSLAIDEQETSISYMRDTDTCQIYTSDTTVMTKLDKLASSDDAPLWKLKEVHRLRDGTVVAKTYETNKNLISYRKDIQTRTMTDEQKEMAAERMKAIGKARKKEEE